MTEEKTVAVEAIAPATKELIALPSGQQVVQKKLKGRAFVTFQSMAAKDAAAASEWLILNSFIWADGSPITPDDLDERLTFEDVATLSAIVQDPFVKAQQRKTS